MKAIGAAVLTLALLAPTVASAQYYGSPGYYQPRVYTYVSPPSYFSQNTYSAVGAGIGGAAGVAVAPYMGPAGPYAPVAGSTAGAIYGGSLYHSQPIIRQYYNAPPAYGMSVTTPYMVRSYRGR